MEARIMIFIVFTAVAVSGCVGSQNQLNDLNQQAQDEAQDQIEKSENALDNPANQTSEAQEESDCPFGDVSILSGDENNLTVKSSAEQPVKATLRWNYGYGDDVRQEETIRKGEETFGHEKSRENAIFGSINIKAINYRDCSLTYTP